MNDEVFNLAVRQFLSHPTVSALAAFAEEAGVALAEQGQVVGEAPLTPIQRWFVEQASPQPHHDNQAVLLELRDHPNVLALEAAIGQIVEHHYALRLRLVGDRQRFAAALGPVALGAVALGAVEEVLGAVLEGVVVVLVVCAWTRPARDDCLCRNLRRPAR